MAPGHEKEGHPMVYDIKVIKELEGKDLSQILQTAFYADGHPRQALPACDFRTNMVVLGNSGIVLVGEGKHWVTKSPNVRVAAEAFTGKERKAAVLDAYLALVDMAENWPGIKDPEMLRIFGQVKAQPKEYRKECERLLAELV